MASVQFYGKDSVIEAAENGGFSCWAIFVGRQLLFKSTDRDANASLNFLDKVLQTISHSEATYTLKFYEPEGVNFKIKENTPCDGSFNFKLVEEEERQARRVLYQGNSAAVLEELKALRNEVAEIKAVKELEDDEDETEKPLSLNGIIAGLLKEPEKITQLFEIGRTLFGRKQNPHIPAVALGNVPQTMQTMTEQDKINAAIERLKANDAKLAEHLTKLSDIAENDKTSWKYLLNLLDQK